MGKSNIVTVQVGEEEEKPFPIELVLATLGVSALVGYYLARK